MIPQFGALTGTTLTATLIRAAAGDHPEDLRGREARAVERAGDAAVHPHIGTLSTSPEVDGINSLTPDAHGGNMDLPDAGAGRHHLPAGALAGARLFIGDAHACQGDGEVCGVAVEYASLTTIQVDLIKGWTIEWPRLEREDFIMAIGSARPLEDAARIAYRELVLWMEAEYGFAGTPTCCSASAGGCGWAFVDPKYTVGAGILKQYLAA